MVNIKNAVAECVGSFIMVFCGIGILCQDTSARVAPALGMGFVFVALYYTVGKSSKCHLNPAVSLGALLKGNLELIDFILYIVCQIVGACLGALALFGFYEMVYNLDKTHFVYDAAIVLPDFIQKGLTARGLFATYFVENVLTSILVFVVLSVEASKDFQEYNGVIIGCTYAFCSLAGMGFDLACLNPARGLATCLSQVTYFKKAESFETCLVWIIAEMIAGIVGYVLTLIVGDGKGNEEPTKVRTGTTGPMNSEEQRIDNA